MHRLPRIAVPLLAALLLTLTGCDGGGTEPATTATPAANTAAPAPTAAAPTASPAIDAPRPPVVEPEPGKPMPKAVFEPRAINFGVVEPQAELAGSARLWNVSDAPLTVLKSVTSCGCTSAQDLAGTTIAPGAYVDMDVEMAVKSGLGLKREKVTIVFDGLTYAWNAVLMIGAEASLPVRATPPHIDALQTTSGTIDLMARDGRPFRVLSAGGAEPVFVNFDPEYDTPRAGYRLRWDISDAVRADDVPWFWMIETDRADASLIDVRIRHNTTRVEPRRGRPWVSKDQRLIVGDLRPGESKEITTKIEYDRPRIPEPHTAGVIVDGLEDFDVEFVRAEVDKQMLVYTLRVTMRMGDEGVVFDRFRLEASGASNALRLIGRRVY